MPALLRSTLCLFALSGVMAQPTLAQHAYSREHQIVLISFDNANEISQWQRSRVLAAATGARFTYFLSCVFLLTPETKDIYQAPGQESGRSNIGFSPSKEDVASRLNQIWSAHSDGHEIASHACGHFNGAQWSEADWARELASFSTLLRDAWRINRIEGEPSGWRHFATNEIKGFRAPYLAGNGALEAALKNSGYLYNASAVSAQPAPPMKRGGLFEFSLPEIAEGPGGQKVVAMDYNLFVRHSGAVEDPGKAAESEERAFAAFQLAFDKEYVGNRMPLQIGLHFTQMQGGAYWRALERFVRANCTRADVDCITYSDYLSRPRGGAGG